MNTFISTWYRTASTYASIGVVVVLAWFAVPKFTVIGLLETCLLVVLKQLPLF